MVKDLYLIRHATAEDAGNSAMLRDFDRELTSKGVMQSARLGKYMADKGLVPQEVHCSPAVRTLKTATLVAEQMKLNDEAVKANETLYGGGPRGYLALVNSLSEEVHSVALVGHNPDITFFAEYLCTKDVGGSMKKGTLIHFRFENLNWAEVSQKSADFISRLDVKKLFENE